MTGPLTGSFIDRADSILAATDHQLAGMNAGDLGTREPIHTVYLPADRFTAATAADWGGQAREAVAAIGGLPKLVELIGLDPGDAVTARVATKLATEPVEDLRLDFEDGYGNRGDGIEDADVVAAGRAVAAAVAAGTAPPFVGIRFKSFERASRRRGLRTLELFVCTLADAGGLPPGLRLTLPKVSTPDQVTVLSDACQALEEALRLDTGQLRFELQMETPRMILGVDGTCPIPAMIHRGGGRVSGLHYGTYDYSDGLRIAAPYQSLEHPAADHAKAVMQVAVAGTGIRLSDGSTNVLPVGDQVHRRWAWQLHARLVRRSLEHGFYQGWDLHPAQLPTRFLATFAFYREGFDAAAARLRPYLETGGTELADPGEPADDGPRGVLDEPATLRPQARFVHDGLLCGALDAGEVAGRLGATPAAIAAMAGRPSAAAEEAATSTSSSASQQKGPDR